MKYYIAGILPLSTVDWPGTVSTVIFFAGCDFRCPFCYNADILEFDEKYAKDINDIKNTILENKDFIDGILFSGGECTLQRQLLIELSKFAKKNDLGTGIETNGSKPDVIKELISEKLVDFVAMDMKAPLTKDKFEKLTGSKTFFKKTEEIISCVKKSLSILKKNQDNIKIHIRTTFVPGILDKEDMLNIAEDIKELKCVWEIQQFRSDKGELIDLKLKDTEKPKKGLLENIKKECNEKYSNIEIKIKAS